jgi:hypothetical protein
MNQQRTLTWYTPFCSGGLCDRLLGMITSYCIAKELGRKFLIKWDQNDMSSIFTINPEHNYYTYNYSLNPVILNNRESMVYFENQIVEIVWKNFPNVLIWSNLNLFQYFCKSRPHINYEKTILESISTIFTRFFIPVDHVKKSLRTDLETVTGIHIRTQDNQLNNPELQYRQTPYITDILIRCKKHIEDNEGEKTIFLASDCVLVNDIAKNIFGTNYILLYNEGPKIHSGQEQKFLNDDGLKHVLIDLLSLRDCKKLYIGWNTNFSRMGVLLKPEKKFYTYEHPNQPKNTVSCTMLELLNYFSNGWRM